MTYPVWPGVPDTPGVGRYPTYDSKEAGTIAVLKADFGDGYGQTSVDGINFDRAQWQLTWPMLTVADALTLKNFLINQAGAPFLWTPPFGGTQGQWRCTARPQLMGTGRLYRSLSAVFDKDYSLS